MAHELVIATHNASKVAELAEILADLPLRLLTLDEAGVSFDVAETGATLAENAILKAEAYAIATGRLTLADDSGLEVDALHGAPGVQTARYGGAGLTAVERYERLLAALAGTPTEARTARFRCVIAVAGDDGRLLGTAEGICEGVITAEPAGDGGFGYDPVFYLPERGQTMAQVPAHVKNIISHRGRAVTAIRPLLAKIIAGEAAGPANT